MACAGGRAYAAAAAAAPCARSIIYISCSSAQIESRRKSAACVEQAAVVLAPHPAAQLVHGRAELRHEGRQHAARAPQPRQLLRRRGGRRALQAADQRLEVLPAQPRHLAHLRHRRAPRCGITLSCTLYSGALNTSPGAHALFSWKPVQLERHRHSARYANAALCLFAKAKKKAEPGCETETHVNTHASRRRGPWRRQGGGPRARMQARPCPAPRASTPGAAPPGWLQTLCSRAMQLLSDVGKGTPRAGRWRLESVILAASSAPLACSAGPAGVRRTGTSAPA